MIRQSIDPDPVSYLVKRRFPFAGSMIDEPVQPSDRGEPSLLTKMRAYEAELRTLPEEQVGELVRDEQRKELLEAQFGQHAQDRSSKLLEPGTEADFDHWARMAYWAPKEGIPLICGRSPTAIRAELLDRALDRGSPFAARFLWLLQIVQRAEEARVLYSKVRPAEFMAWVKRLELPYPPELDAAVTKYAGAWVDWRARYLQLEQTVKEERATQADDRKESQPAEPKPLKTRERETVLKIMIGMAVRAYRWDPDAGRSDAISELCSDLDSVGLPVHADTVRNYLREAAALLPPEMRGKSKA